MKALCTLVTAPLSAVLLAACSANSPSSAPLSALSAQRQTNQTVQIGKVAGPTLYVAEDGGVGVYSQGGASLLRKLRPKSGQIATETTGHLFLGLSSTATVKVFSNQGATLVQKFHVRGGPGGYGDPNAMVVDASGNLYVIGSHYVYEYALGNQEPIRTIDPSSISLDMTVDPSGNLYVGINYNEILVYAPGSTSPQRTITDGIGGPARLVCDSLGDLYVANTNSGSNHIPNIVVYAPGGSSPVRTITDGVNDPQMMSFDGAGNLFVLNRPTASSGPNVTVYAAGSSSPSHVVSNELDYPNWIALDSANDLYVANLGYSFSDPGSISVYAAGSYQLIRSVTRGIRKPGEIALGP